MIGSRRRLLTYAMGNRQKRICIIVIREEIWSSSKQRGH